MSRNLLDRVLHPNREPESHEERFLQAFDEYSDALFRHAFFRLSDRERAVELVHDTYTKVWTYIKDGNEVTSFRAFLYKILNNLIIDEYRKRKEASLDELLDADSSDERYFNELQEGSLEETMFSLDAKNAIKHLDELPPQYREVIVLRYIDGLGPKEISELIEASENVVSLRIHRGLKTLKQIIHDQEARADAKRTQT